ncbi:hypothetical protein MMAGJ_67470 [Mycolicibacterium mageritense]|uniref:Uncharacterized protein n=2 Tax=Mycolicibacterium mageritense TaxID=53462 RepID=A0ABM7I3K3_MYCME|nr:hypothetical protein MMAGJ_67470 [Mycolicibacterium mageritense]
MPRTRGSDDRYDKHSEGTSMISADRVALTGPQLEAIARDFLRSEFTERIYGMWPIDRRIDAYLRHRGFRGILNDGSACSRLTDRVMANLGRVRCNPADRLSKPVGLQSISAPER